MQGHCIVGRSEAPISDKEFGHSRFEMIKGFSLIFVPGNTVNQRPGRLNKYFDVRQFMFNGLKLRNGPPELVALSGVSNAFIEDIGHAPDKRGHECAPIPLHCLHGHEEAGPFLADQVPLWDFAVIKNQLRGMRTPHPHFVQVLSCGKTGCVLFYYKDGYPCMFLIFFGLGIDNRHVCNRPVCDKHLVPVQDITVFPFLCVRGHGCHIRACARLSEPHTAYQFARAQLRDIFFPLGIRPMCKDSIGAKKGVGAIGK